MKVLSLSSKSEFNGASRSNYQYQYKERAFIKQHHRVAINKMQTVGGKMYKKMNGPISPTNKL